MDGERGSHSPSPWVAGEEINDSALAHRTVTPALLATAAWGVEGLLLQPHSLTQG